MSLILDLQRISNNWQHVENWQLIILSTIFLKMQILQTVQVIRYALKVFTHPLQLKTAHPFFLYELRKKVATCQAGG